MIKQPSFFNSLNHWIFIIRDFPGIFLSDENNKRRRIDNERSLGPGEEFRDSENRDGVSYELFEFKILQRKFLLKFNQLCELKKKIFNRGLVEKTSNMYWICEIL